MLHVYVDVHAACPCPCGIRISILHFHVHYAIHAPAACPIVHVYSSCPSPCCMSNFPCLCCISNSPCARCLCPNSEPNQGTYARFHAEHEHGQGHRKLTWTRTNRSEYVEANMGHPASILFFSHKMTFAIFPGGGDIFQYIPYTSQHL